MLFHAFTSDLGEGNEHTLAKLVVGRAPNWGCGERANESKGRAGRSNRLSGATQNSARTNAKSCMWKGRNGHQGTGWGPESFGRQQTEPDLSV